MKSWNYKNPSKEKDEYMLSLSNILFPMSDTSQALGTAQETIIQAGEDS